MKIEKLFLAFIFAIAFFKADAQWEKGSYLFGTGLDGDLSIGRFPPMLNNSQGTIDMGYFVKNRLLLGAGLAVNAGNRINRNWLDYNLDIFSRYYFSVKDRWSYYGEGFIGFGQQAYNFQDLGLKANNFRGTYGVGLGTNYSITKRIHFDAAVRYRVNDFFDDSSKDFGKLSTRVGFKFNLSGKKKK